MTDNSIKYNTWKFIVFFLITILFQQLAPHISVMGIGPNIAFILVMCSVMLEENAPNTFYAFVFGVIYDFMNGKISGIYVLVFVLISWGTAELYHKYFENMTAIEILCLILSFFVYGMLFTVFFALNDEEFGKIFVRITLIEFIYNSLLGVTVYTIYKGIIRKVSGRKHSAWRI